MCCLSYTTWAQTQSNVNGLVTDFSGEPLIGVSILVKGTSNGTVTDLDGKFSLSAEMGNMLQISYVGYISQEIKVESNKLLRIIMEEDTKKLEEVVVVGDRNKIATSLIDTGTASGQIPIVNKNNKIEILELIYHNVAPSKTIS
jgi:hypothetical protein